MLELLPTPRAEAIPLSPLVLEPSPSTNAGPLSAALRSFREGKHNVFFDEHAAITRWLDEDPTLPTQLEAMLAQPPQAPVRGLDDLESPPEEALERMTALDVLEELARDPRAKEAAESTLVGMIQRPLEDASDEATLRNMVVEKMEALEALCRVDLGLGLDTLGSVAHMPLQKKLETAALRGMIDTGFRAEDAQMLLAEVRTPR